MAAIAPPSSAELLDLIRRSNILPADRLRALPDANELPPEPTKAATVLVQKAFITKFQAAQLLAGRHKGFRIGQYVIQDILGRGGMGAVYLAEHLDLHRKVAVKILAPGKGEDQKLALERFLREARAAAALDHPNIVRIFDVARHNEVPYLVMEFVEGDTLQQSVDRDGPMLFDVAAECIAQAAAGLQHAHEKGFVHRDIKPANLIRDKFGTIKILDMGLARSGSDRDKLTELLDEGAVVGTADYISPEQAINCPTVDARADIYSLGATLFTLVVGKTPFEGNTTQKLMQHQLRTAPPLRELNPDVPEELAEVVAKMLAKKPGDRYQSSAEVIAALAPWAATSTRVLAGLSQTTLGAVSSSTKLGAANSSRRLLAQPSLRGSDSSVDHSESAKPTGVLSSEDTLRDPKPDEAPEPVRAPALVVAQSDGKKKLFAGIVIASLVLIIGIVAWLAFGRGKAPEGKTEAPPDAVGPAPAPAPAPKLPVTLPPKVNPNPPKFDVPPKPPGPKEEIAYRLDPASIAAFRVRMRGGTVVDGKRGSLPAGVGLYALKDGEAEFSAEKIDGTAALAIRRHAAGGDTHFAFELERDASNQGIGLKLKPDAEYKVRIRYRTDGAVMLGVSVHTLAYKGGAYKVFPATGGKWSAAELPFTRGQDPFRMTISGNGPVGTQVAVGTVELVEIRGEKVRQRLDLAGQESFVTRSGLNVDPVDMNKKTYKPIAQTGPGALPTGWTARCWNKDTEMEAFAETGAGAPVIGIRNVQGPGSAMLFTPRFECPSGFARLRVEYAANVREKALTLRFKADDQRSAWDVTKPAVGGDAWRTEEVLVDLKGAAGGVFEFHNADATAGSAVRLRALSVVEPNPVSPDHVVFKFDAYDLPGFKNTKTGRTKTSGEDDPKIKGVYFAGWKPETESEWVCAPVAGEKALGFTNLSEVISAEIGIDLETGVGLKFTPGQILRVRVTYRTAGKGRGSVFVQNADDKKVPDRVSLPTSNSVWKTVELVTVRGTNPLRCLVNVSEKGAGNTLFVRSVTVSEVGPPRPLAAVTAPAPAPAPKTDPALDPATWSEGATVYVLDVSAITPFRTQKERGKRLGGDAEVLPVGIGCQCWREGSVGEFQCAKLSGVPALGVTNLNDEKSGQYTFGFEGAMKLALQPGKGYRVKLGYKTANDAAGSMAIQLVPGYKGLVTTRLTNTTDAWKTATMSFVRPPTEDKVEVRMAIDNTSVGEGNTVWLRSLEIVELVPPKK